VQQLAGNLLDTAGDTVAVQRTHAVQCFQHTYM
jgi:hypothetical protein